MTDRPCITALIEDLPKATEDHEVSALVRKYAQDLRDCGEVTSPRSAWPAIVSATTDDILSLLRAAYLDGVAHARQQPVFATVADARPPVDHEVEVKRSLGEEFNPYMVPHTPQRNGRDTCNCLSCRSGRLGVADDSLTRRPYSRDGWR